MSGDDPHPLVEPGDDVLRRGRLEKRDVVVAARCEDTLPRLPHFRRIGVARDRDITEREAEIAGTHFGKAEPRHGDDLLAISDALGAFQLDAEPRSIPNRGCVPRPSDPLAALMARPAPRTRSTADSRFGSTPAE